MAEKPNPLGNGRDLLLAVVVGIFGIATIVLGIARVTGDIGSSFEAYNPTDYEIATTQTELAKENQEKLSRDTDGDGLNDFVEEFQFGTSAYLTDTDSDGRSDKEEIDEGEDPLCARGKTCRTFVEGDGSTEIAAAEELTADEIRELLVSSTDLDLKALKEIPDDELIALYHETIGEVENPFQVTSTGSDVSPEDLYADLEAPDATPLPGTNVVITSLDDVRSLSPEEVRSFLYSIGATDEDLSGLSDEILYELLIDLVEAQLGQAIPESAEDSGEEDAGNE